MLDGLIGFICHAGLNHEFREAHKQGRWQPNGGMDQPSKKKWRWFYVGVLGELVVLAIDLTWLARNGQTT